MCKKHKQVKLKLFKNNIYIRKKSFMWTTLLLTIILLLFMWC